MAYQFDGTDDGFYTNGGVSGINVQTHTVAFRGYAAALPASGDNRGFMNINTAVTGGNTAFAADIWNLGGTSYFASFAEWSTNWGGWRSTTSVSATTWYNVVWTYDGSSTANNPRLFVNGSEWTVTLEYSPLGTRTGAPNYDSMCIATNEMLDTFANHRVAELAIWSSILSQAQCEQVSGGAHPFSIGLAPNVYFPLIDSTTEVMQGVSLSTNGAPSVQAHPTDVKARPAVFAGLRRQRAA